MKVVIPHRCAHSRSSLGVSAVVVVSAALACGCGESASGDGDSGGKASSGTGGGAGSGGDAGNSGVSGGGSGGAPSASCNTIENDGPEVAQTMLSGTFPEGAGGLIADGVYHLTGVDQYLGGLGPSTATSKDTFRIAGSTMEAVYWISSSPTDARFNWDITTRDADLLQTETCPRADLPAGISRYTATPTTLDILRADYQNVRHYTKE